MSMSEWRAIGEHLRCPSPGLGPFPRGDELVPLDLVCLWPTSRAMSRSLARVGVPVCPRADQEHLIDDFCVREKKWAGVIALLAR